MKEDYNFNWFEELEKADSKENNKMSPESKVAILIAEKTIIDLKKRLTLNSQWLVFYKGFDREKFRYHREEEENLEKLLILQEILLKNISK